MFQNQKLLAASYLSLAGGLKIDSKANDLVTELAELSSEAVNCQVYHERLKYQPNYFYEMLEGDKEYVDDQFTRDNMIYGVYPDPNSPLKEKEPFKFTDSLDIIRSEQDGFSLWGSSGQALAEDILQGQLGNCWFMHGASVVAQKPGRMERVFHNQELSPNGIYALDLYLLGVPTTVVVDDVMPLDERGQPVFAKVSDETKALWPAILEKAVAKVHGSYDSIEGGTAQYSTHLLTGAHETQYIHSSAEHSALSIFDVIMQEQSTYNMISAITREGNDQEQNQVGLAFGHMYTVFSAHEVGSQKLVRVRNPWGAETYDGPWRDGDSRWDQQISADSDTTFKEHFTDLGIYMEKNDGFFFIDYNTYYENFIETVVHEDMSDKVQDSAIFTDTADGDINTHTFTLRSGIAQDVYVSVHTWPSRSYPNECQAATNSNSHKVIIRDLLNDAGRGTLWSFNEWFTFSPFSMGTDEQKTLEITFDWTGMPDSSREFSIVVWRTGRLPVSIASDSLSKTSFPLRWRQEYDVSEKPESGADDCQVNEADSAFVDWYSDMEQFPIITPSEGYCGQNTNSLTMTSGSNVDVYFLIRAKCNVPWRDTSYAVTITQSAEFWQAVKVSSEAHLMETQPLSDGQERRSFHIEEDVDFRIAFWVPTSVQFPGDSLIENLEAKPTAEWEPPVSEWTRTPELVADGDCESAEDLYASMPDCSFADATLANRDELQQTMRQMAENDQLTYRTSQGSKRAVTDLQNGFSIYQLAFWWGEGTRPTDSEATYRYSYTQTLAEWQNTVEYCGNYRSHCSLNPDGTVTKHYYATNEGLRDPINTDKIMFAQPTGNTFSTDLPSGGWASGVIADPSERTGYCPLSKQDLQAQFNKWVDDYEIGSVSGCNLYFANVETAQSSTHDFMIRYGSCNDNGIKVKFNIPSSINLDDVIVSQTDKTYLYADTDDCRQANGCFQADVKEGKKDRIGFAVPKGAGWTMDSPGLWVSSTQA